MQGPWSSCGGACARWIDARAGATTTLGRGWRGRRSARAAAREREGSAYALEAMLAEAERRKRGRQELLERVEANTSEEMDNGVRINPSDAAG